MNVFAILGRELRRTARLRTSYLLRGFFLALLVLIVFGSWWDVVGERNLTSLATLARAGRQLYATFFLVMGALAILVCPILTCGAVADETENRTLEILLTTPMRRTGIVLAKFISRMAYAGMLLLGSLPALIACLAFGGVAPGEVLASTAMLLAGSFWAGSITLMYSTLVRKGYAAALLAYFTMAAWIAGVFLIWGVIVEFRGGPNVWMFILAAPAYFILHVVGELHWLGGTQVEHVVSVLTLFLGSGTLCLWLAGRWLGLRLFAAPRAEETAAPGRRAWSSIGTGAGWLLAWLLGTGLLALLCLSLPHRHWTGFAAAPLTFLVCLSTASACLCGIARHALFRQRRYQAVWENPFLWKEISLPGSRIGRIAPLVLTGATAAVGILMLDGAHAARDDDPPIGMMMAAEAMMLAVVSVVGGYSITAEREQGLLELLVATPAPPARIFDGKVAGTLSHLAPLGLFLLLYLCAAALHGAVRYPVGMLLAVGVLSASILMQAQVACAASLVMRRSTTAILVAFAVPIVIYGVWPFCVAWLFYVLSRHRLDRVMEFLALQPNPFFFIYSAADGAMRGSSEWRHSIVGFPIAYGLHVLGHLGLALAVRSWAVRNLRRRLTAE